MAMWTAVLVFAAFLFVFPFVLYPAILRLLAGRESAPDAGLPDPDYRPSVALVICALNEQKIIREKLENCLELEYPRDRLRVIVVSDGSTDATAAIVREYRARGIELEDHAVRRGKITNLNELVPALSEGIAVLSDANVLYRRDALLRLVARFRDPSVGCVSGRVVLTDTTPDLNGPTDQYYSLEWFLQDASSRIYSMAGADGAMYALRRGLFEPCPNDTLIEDFVIPMAVIRRGKRVVFEGGAVGWEQGVASVREEYRRRIRIAAGAAQALLRGSAWPSGAPLRFWFIFICHKLLRWLSPVSGLLVLVAAWLSRGGLLSQAVLAGFACLGVLASIKMLTRSTHPVVAAPFYFLFGQIAMTVGMVKGLLGRQTVLWAKANR